MRLLLTLICLLIISTQKSAAQAGSKKIHFEERVVKFNEPATPSIKHINIISDTVPENMFQVKVRDLHYDAGKLDYRISPDTVVINISKGVSMIQSVPVLILSDRIPEPDEEIVLVLEYWQKAVNNKKTMVSDTIFITIADTSFTDPAERNGNNQEPATQSNNEHTTSNSNADNHEPAETEETDTGTGKYRPLFDTLFSYNKKPYSLEAGKKDALNYLKVFSYKKGEKEIIDTVFWANNDQPNEFCQSLYSLLEPKDNDTGKITTPICGVLFQGWIRKNEAAASKDTAEKKKKADEEKSAEDNKEYNKMITGLETILKRYNAIEDPATTRAVVKLKNVQLYLRDMRNAFGNKSARKADRDLKEEGRDPIGDYSQSYNYYNALDSVTIDSLSIRIEDGYIAHVMIELKPEDAARLQLNRKTTIRRYMDIRSSREAGEVLNSFFPLESTSRFYRPRRINSSRSKEPAKTIEYSRFFVNMNDILNLYPQIDSISDQLVHVKNRNFSFGKSSPAEIKLTDKDFSSFAQLNIFSDLVGLSEDKPNGLIQAEGKFETGLFTQPWFSNRYYSRFRFRMLSSASLQVGISKIENKLKYFEIPRDPVYLYNNEINDYETTPKDSVKHINTAQILQYSNLNVTACFNLLNFESDYTSINVYGGFGLIRTPINDTLSGRSQDGNTMILNENKSIVNTLRFFYGFKLRLKSTSNLGMDIGLGFSRLRLNSNDIRQTYSTFKSSGNNKENILKTVKINSSLHNIFTTQLITPSLNIYYHIDRDQQKRFYIRASYTTDLKSKTDDFFSMQFGYSTDLKGFFSQFKKT